MNGILLTQNSTFIIGQVAWLLGKIMEGIFEVLNMIGIPNIGRNHPFYNCCEPVDDASYHQTAEILQTFC